MKIVYLDAYTANPGDLSWEPLQQLGELQVYDRSTDAEVLQRIGDAELVLTNKVVFDPARFAALPKLKYVGVTATGYNIIDIDAAREHGVTVTNVPAYSTASVAQMTFALLLEMTQQVGHHNHLTSWGHWTEAPDFCFWDKPQVELEGLTIGLVGFGQIGQRVARIAAAFGMQVKVFTRTPDRCRGRLEFSQIHFTTLDDLLQGSEVVSLHCPLNDDTAELINAERLALMKPGAYLINTSRGALVDETALADALREKRLAGAGLDVLVQEPPLSDNRLLAAQNCFVTPHIAWATRASRQRLFDTLAANVKAFLYGTPQNVVNP